MKKKKIHHNSLVTKIILCYLVNTFFFSILPSMYTVQVHTTVCIRFYSLSISFNIALHRITVHYNIKIHIYTSTIRTHTNRQVYAKSKTFNVRSASSIYSIHTLKDTLHSNFSFL